MNLEHYKASSERTDDDERALIPAFKRAPNKAQPLDMLRTSTTLTDEQSKLLAKASHADKLAEACKSLAKFSEGWTSEQMNNAIRKAQSALAAYEAAQ